MEQHLFTCDNSDCGIEQRDPENWFTLRDYFYYNERQLVVTRLNPKKPPKEGDRHLCSAPCVLKVAANSLSASWGKTLKTKKGPHAAS